MRRLTRATEHVTETGDLSERIDVHRPATSSAGSRASFNTMLDALEDSTRAQRQLVADASHELRTPLTSLRTNIEVLASERPLPPGERERLLDDVVEQLGEMTTLIAELVELARGERAGREPEDVRLDLVVAARSSACAATGPASTFDDRPGRVDRPRRAGDARARDRQPARQRREVEPARRRRSRCASRDGEVIVRDHGPGIDEEDLPFVFDRFYRARGGPRPAAAPGSGSRSSARSRRRTAAGRRPSAPRAAAR